MFLVFPFIYAFFREPPFSMGIGHTKEKSSKSKREKKKLYDLNPFAQFEWFANPHVRCNNHVLPALVSGIYYEHEADQHYRNPYIHLDLSLSMLF